ncbi:MAG: M20 family peptidase [Myxococcota bacterium]|jgi:carboxypeptidase PM20D1|nr:M20 family peptidase [Myxococcota bacterium]
MRFSARVLLFALALLLAIVVFRTLSFESRQIESAPAAVAEVDAAAAADRLARGLRHRTISHSLEGPVEAEAFLALHRQLEADYPRVHATLQREVVSQWSLLYTWRGKRPEEPAVLLLAHQDVVPVDPTSVDAWTHPPFDGVIDDGTIWGRGAIDDKGSLFAILEAVEALIESGFEPERNVLLAFGHDEELGGDHGATAIASLLRERGTPVDYVLDEGGAVTIDTMTLVSNPVAVVGIAEKGMASIVLSIDATGGHSSIPPRQTAIGILAAAIAALERNPMPARIDGTVDLMLDHLGPELSFPLKLVMANRWLFSTILSNVFSDDPTLDALQRTTTAATVFHGGVKPNVLPSRVEAVVNFRVLPGDTIASVRDHVARTIDDDRITIELMDAAREPSGVAPIDSNAFVAIQKAIGSHFPDTIVTPYLVVGGTDSRYFGELTDNIYRFMPFEFTPDDRSRMHGTDERVEIRTLVRAISFYRSLIEKSAGPGFGSP